MSRNPTRRALLRKRRLRRTARQVLAHGQTAKRPHRRVAGRSGSIRGKQLAAAFAVYLAGLALGADQP